MSTQQPEALRLALMLRGMGANSFIAKNLDKAAAELEHLHARVQELEAQQERKPLALYQRDTIKANAWKETREGGYYDANEIISATEAAHGIQEKQG